MQNDIIKTVRNELKLNSSAAVRLSAKKFFKEEAKHYGVKSAVVGEIAAKSFRDLQGFGKREIFSLCEELFRFRLFRRGVCGFRLGLPPSQRF